jgi:ferric iron reductase protein FhuF
MPKKVTYSQAGHKLDPTLSELKPAASSKNSSKNLGFLMVKLALPNGTINPLRERRKTSQRSWGIFVPQVDKTRSSPDRRFCPADFARCGTPLIRVGCGVIAARYSEVRFVDWGITGYSP